MPETAEEDFYTSQVKRFVVNHTNRLFFSLDPNAADEDLLPLGGVETSELNIEDDIIEKMFYNNGGVMTKIKVGMDVSVTAEGTYDMNDPGQEALLDPETRMFAMGDDTLVRFRYVTRAFILDGKAHVFSAYPQPGEAAELMGMAVTFQFDGKPTATRNPDFITPPNP